jgi:ABC-type transport system involved in cytochrome bd biosynthesis fused ATPase/permease subunit
MSLLSTTYQLLKETGFLQKLIIWNTINCIWDLTLSILQQNMHSDFETIKILIGIWFFINPLFASYLDKLSGEIGQQISIKWSANQWKLYNNGTHDARLQHPPDKIDRLMSRAQNNISTTMSWGFHTIINLVMSSITTFYIFTSNGMLFNLLLLTILNITSYHKFTKNMLKKFFQDRHRLRDESDHLECKKSMILPGVQYKETSVDDINDIDRQIMVNNAFYYNAWDRITFWTNITNGGGILVSILLRPDLKPSTILLVIFTLKSFSGSLGECMNFMNRYSELDGTFNSFTKEFNAFINDQQDDVVKAEFPEVINIPVQTFNRHQFNVHVAEHITIKQGDRVLITGPSAAGKTTFIDALTGMFVGMTLGDMVDPRSIHHHFIKFFQNIKEKVLTSKTTIRNLFNDEKDDETINKFLHIVDMDEWARKLTLSEKPKHEYPDWSIMDFMTNWLIKLPYMSHLVSFYEKWFKPKPKTNDDIEIGNTNVEPVGPSIAPNSLDIEINERHSGGQKTRLILATRLYKLHKTNAACLILDEPEQGIDPPLAYKILKRIHKTFNQTPIIFNNHLEKIHEKKWITKWLEMHSDGNTGTIKHAF